MTDILILYYSRHGAVKQLATLIARGVEKSGTTAILRTVPNISSVCQAVEEDIPKQGDPYVSIQDLQQCDGLILGSPTRFGNMAAELKYFIDQTASIWLSGELNNKPAGVFTSSSSMHGGQESTLLSMMLPLMHHGMVLAGIPFSGTPLSTTKTGGTPYGASHVSGAQNNNDFSADEKTSAQLLGERIGKLALKLI